MAPCGAGDPFDCGRRARKSRWKSRAGAESTRLVVLVPKITVLRAWDTSGIVRSPRSRMRPHAPPSPSPTLPSPSPPPPSPSPTLASLSPPASFPSPPPPSPSLPPPSPSRRHLATTIAIDRHRPRRHGLRHPLPGRRRRRLRLRLRLSRERVHKVATFEPKGPVGGFVSPNRQKLSNLEMRRILGVP